MTEKGSVVEALRTRGRPGICGLCKSTKRACEGHLRVAVADAIPLAEAMERENAEMRLTLERIAEVELPPGSWDGWRGFNAVLLLARSALDSLEQEASK